MKSIKMKDVLGVSLMLVSCLLVFQGVAEAGIKDAMQSSSTEALAAANAATDYLYIFSLIAFLMGIGCFMPGIRQPGWGAAAIVVAIIALSAPSCVNNFGDANAIKLGATTTATPAIP